MHIVDAQREMRFAFLGGCAGQTVAGLIWLAAGAAARATVLYEERNKAESQRSP